jgi:hypothetical protein
VTLDKSLKDRFNQTLGRNQTFEFKVGSFPRRFRGPSGSMMVMDPGSADPLLCLYAELYEPRRSALLSYSRRLAAVEISHQAIFKSPIRQADTLPEN